jgi:diguanylate cyclase (GGDEF)-like protein
MAPSTLPLRASAPLAALLERAGEFQSRFQPIASLSDGHALGFEALLRLPDNAGFAGPGEAFHAAIGTPLLLDLEFAALETHLRAARNLPEARLFLNFSAPAFSDPRMAAGALARRVRSAGYAPERIVLEISELVDVEDPARFAELLRPLREQSFHFAVDDFGAGFANVRLLAELGPEFVKVDRALVTDAYRHPRKRVFLETIGALGRRINCSVVAEGVESHQDLLAVRACGIPAAQGYLLGAPEAAEQLSTLSLSLRRTLCEPESPEECIGALALPREGVSPATRVGDLVLRLEREPEPPAVPVLEGERAIGLVTQNVLFFHLGHRYGYALWSQRPVGDFLAAHSEGIDRLAASASVEEAAEVVRRRPAWRRFDPLVIEDDAGGYHGLLPVDLLLGEMTRLKVEYALQANPLTGLPGSVVLARAAEARLMLGRPFALGWADLDHFKPFNDRYGFGRGDSALMLLAETLREHLQRQPGELLAHPGGDDFAFLIEPAEAEQRALCAAREFSERVVGLYDEADRAQGGISSIDRRGQRRQFDFMSVSIGLVLWQGEAAIDYRRLLEIAAEVKTAAKRKPGPAVMTNTRALTLEAGSGG